MQNICIITKILILIVLVLVFYKLYKQHEENQPHNNLAEGFENINYLKLTETYLEPDQPTTETKLNLLYANYSGEEIGNETWENKTLDQCTDLCNQLPNCIGFSRDLVNDDAPAKCYPRTKITNCHSNRKGDTIQMQNAIKYNSYVKADMSKTKSVLTKCIGDTNLTLNRSVYIKSQLYPKKYIGTVGDGLAVLVDQNDIEFQKKCNFRIEVGKDGIGTVSFLHIDSNMYLYRNTIPSNPTNTSNSDLLSLKDITNNKTSDKQRASFNILDGMKNLMKFKCLALDGETTDKYIIINPDNKNYLSCMEINNTLDQQQYIFTIVDNIVKSTVIQSKNNLPTNTIPTITTTIANTILNTTPTTTNANTNANTIFNMNNKEKFQQTDAIGNIINTSKPTSIILDTVDNIPLYKNIFTTPTTVNVQNYINDNYGTNIEKGGTGTGNNVFFSVSKKMNDIVLNNQLSHSITKKQDEYDAITQLNLEIEKEIANLNMGINAKNDKMYNYIDKMRINDMANDYFTLKNINQNPLA
jgi:hypothetical protein